MSSSKVFKHIVHHPKAFSHILHKDNEIGFLSNDDLASRMLENLLPTIVVDCRDDGAQGGYITGALFCPEARFGSKEMKRLLGKSIEKHNLCHGISNHKCFVIFYCVQSVERSLRCAQNFWQYVRENGYSNDISVRVLRGGAHGFIPLFADDKRLVLNFDAGHWSFQEDHSLMHAVVQTE
jgi:hypothetical protein